MGSQRLRSLGLQKGAGYVCDDDELAPDTNQEEVTPDHDHTASREEPSSARSSPRSDYLSLADSELIPHDSRLQPDDQQQSSPVRHDERMQIDPEIDRNTLTTAASSHAVDLRPAGSRLQGVVQGLLSMSVGGSATVVRPPSGLAVFASCRSLTLNATTQRPQTGLKSILRKSKVESEISVPSPRSVRFVELETPTTRSSAIQPKAEAKQPPSPRTPPTSPWLVQRCEDIEKRKQEKARRELQVQEAARKQREEMKRMIEESQEKNRAADRERLTSLRKKVYERSPLAFKNR
jgi:hypothetical protein